MRIPSDAVISPDKLRKYLLVFQPQNDKSGFLAQAGFTSANPEMLETAIRALIATTDAIFDRHDHFGDFYRVEGTLKGLNGYDLQVVTIWILRTEDQGLYRFVTLKPGRKNDHAT